MPRDLLDSIFPFLTSVPQTTAVPIPPLTDSGSKVFLCCLAVDIAVWPRVEMAAKWDGGHSPGARKSESCRSALHSSTRRPLIVDQQNGLPPVAAPQQSGHR